MDHPPSHETVISDHPFVPYSIAANKHHSGILVISWNYTARINRIWWFIQNKTPSGQTLNILISTSAITASIFVNPNQQRTTAKQDLNFLRISGTNRSNRAQSHLLRCTATLIPIVTPLHRFWLPSSRLETTINTKLKVWYSDLSLMASNWNHSKPPPH